jgi:hypothetical protein
VDVNLETGPEGSCARLTRRSGSERSSSNAISAFSRLSGCLLADKTNASAVKQGCAQDVSVAVDEERVKRPTNSPSEVMVSF